jgi:hypothetical protein
VIVAVIVSGVAARVTGRVHMLMHAGLLYRKHGGVRVAVRVGAASY